MKPPALRVREARLDDAEPMARVVVSANSIFRGLLPEASLVSYEESATNWRRCLQEKPLNEYLYVAEEGTGELVGLAMCGPQAEGDPLYRGEIYILCVLESRQRQGIGRLLVRRAAERLAEDGITSLLIRCMAVNPNRAFYERLGGAAVRERTIEECGATLTELAYGWTDTRVLR